MKLFSLFGGLVAASEKVDYSGSKVLRITVEDESMLKFIEAVSADFDIWKDAHVKGDVMDVLVPEQYLSRTSNALRSRNVAFDVMVDDVQALIDETTPKNTEYTSYADFDYNNYHTFDEHQAWQADFAAENSDIVTVVNYGTSLEGRPLNTMVIGNGSRKMILHGGTHSREWINPIEMINFSKQLVEEYRAGGESAKYLNDLQWHITINTNPDGYVYSWTNDRMWRKTRNPDTDGICVGVDPNRNWDACWGCPGASANSCSQTYWGKSVFSEVETKAAADYITNMEGPVVGYADVHAYSQYWMTPFGYKRSHPKDYDVQMQVSNAARDAIYGVHRKLFATGSIYDVIYQASGNTADWVYETANVKCSFALELRDKGQYGFMLPADQIQPVKEEMWAGFTAWADLAIQGLCDQ